MLAKLRRGLLAFAVCVVLCAIGMGAFGVMSQPILIDAMGRGIGALQLAQLTAVEGKSVSKEILRAGPKGFTLEAERDWWQARKRLAEALETDGTVTLSLGGSDVVATVTRSVLPGLKSDLGLVLGSALLFVLGCVVIAKRHASPAGMALALYLIPGTFVLLAAGVFALVQITLPYWIHRTLFALTAFGNVGVAAGLHFALIFPRPHARWRIGQRGLWIFHAAVIVHCMLVALGVLAYTTLVPVSAVLAIGMTVLIVQQFREEQNSALKVHLLLLACPLPVACVLLFVFYAFAPDLGLPRIDGSYLPLTFLIALVVYAAVFENATLQQQRVAEQLSLREELHDELLSRLANISLLSEVALQSQSDRESLATRLTSIQGEARANASYARELLRISGDRGWEDFCAQLHETGIALTRDHAVRFSLVSSRQDGGRIPPTPMRICLYKMLREAIHNTLKHARASAIDVELTLRGDTIQFRYCDDGTGFDESTLHPGHYGLGMLRRRAQELGAALHIDSSAESGTTLAFSGPVA
jgi:signal transduction histidine kinase